MKPAKFKVGDEIIVHIETTLGDDAYKRAGWTGRVTEVLDFNYYSNTVFGRKYAVSLVYNGQSSPEWFIGENNLKLLSEKKGSFMSTIVEKAKFMALPADDKVLRKQGFVDATGKLTTEGREMLEQINFEANKKALVETARALEAEEKAEKKAS